MTTTCELPQLGHWNNPAAPRRAVVAPRSGTPTPIRSEATAIASLGRLWRGALADEARTVAPFERMGFSLLVFAGAVAVLEAVAANSRFVESLPAFTAWVDRLLGTG